MPCLQITSSAHANEVAMSIAVSCQIALQAPFSRPTQKESMPTSSPGPIDVNVLLRAGDRAAA
jgi:hypothetical protein